MELVVNGKSNADRIIIQENTAIQSTCLAKRSRLPVYLIWKINDGIVEETWRVTTKTLQSSGDRRTFDTESTLKFSPEVMEGNITCQVNALNDVRYYHASFYVKGKPPLNKIEWVKKLIMKW